MTNIGEIFIGSYIYPIEIKKSKQTKNEIYKKIYFQDIDELISGAESELIYMNLYVGLSKANFYLGITSSEKLEDYYLWKNILKME